MDRALCGATGDPRATSSTSPTGSTCAGDIRFGTTVTAADWDDAGNGGRSDCDAGETVRAHLLSSWRRQPLGGQAPGLRRAGRLRGRVVPHRPLAAPRAWISQADASPSSAPARPASRPSRGSPRRREHLVVLPAHAQLLACPRRTVPSTPASSTRPARRSPTGAGSASSPTRACPSAPERRDARASAEGAPHALRGGLAARRHQRPVRRVHRLLHRRDRERQAQEFARSKIREIVRDPDTAELLCPKHHIGTKRHLRGHRLLRDLQPGQRRAHRRPRAPDRAPHPERHRSCRTGISTSTSSCSRSGSTR